MDMEYRFPQYLSAPMQFMWFDSDTFFLICLFLVIAMIFGGWWFFVAILGPMGYANLKKRTSASFLIHLMYFTGFKKFSHYPLFFETNFQE